MRDVVFKTITSGDHKTRQVAFKESVEDHGISAKTEKGWSYAVKNIIPLSAVGDFKKWMAEYTGSENPPSVKNLSILRGHNSKINEDKFEYLITNDLFVIHQDKMFIIEFTYFFSIVSVALTVKNKGA